MRTTVFVLLLCFGCGSSGDGAADAGTEPDADDALPRDGLPLGTLCDGSAALVYDQQLLERVDCGSGAAFAVAPPRLESEPRTPSPYEAVRCRGSIADEAPAALFECAETEFWHAYSDGRLATRDVALSYMTEAIERLTAAGDGSAAFNKKLARLHQLRGMFYMALGLENGVVDYLIGAEQYATADFARVGELDPGNFVARSFDLTLEMTFARLGGEHERAAELAHESLQYALHLGNPDVVEDVNVGAVFAVTGTTMTWPVSSGVAQESLDAKLAVGCIDSVEFCNRNTLHAPYARPGLEYHLAELYARLGRRTEYIDQLDVVAAQPGYRDWAWYDVVEMQRADPNLLLDKYATYGDDGYADSYATMNNGCVMCHGRI